MTDTYDAEVIVIGLGAVGAALAFQLAEAGVRVIGLERFGPAHAFGSSHGETRITRDYPGEGDEYVPLVARSHRIWAQLAERGHAGLREQCGLLVMARSGADGRAAAHRHGVPDFLAETIRIAERFGPPATMLDAAALRAGFPQFEVTDDTVAYFDPHGGFVRPEACVRAQLDEATKAGAVLRFDEPMTALARDGAGVAVTTAIGVYRAPKVVMCAGAWTPSLAGGRFAEALVVRPQVQYWFRATEPELWARAPAYIWFHGDGPADMIYGFPMVEGGAPGGVKAAIEQYDAACSPDHLAEASDTPLADAATTFERHIAGRLRGVSSEPVQALTCLYTVNEGAGGSRPAAFLIGPHPAIDGVTVVSACSGHGFKHSAGLGQALAERLRGLPCPDLEPFDLPAR